MWARAQATARPPAAGVLQALASPQALVALAAGGAVLIGYLRRWRASLSLDRFARVPGLPWFGVALQLTNTLKTVERLEDWSREYGKGGAFEFNLAGQHVVACCEWAIAKEVLDLRPFKMTRSAGLTGTDLALHGVFFAEGRQWSQHWRLTAPAFSEAAMKNYLPATCSVVATLLDQVEIAVQAGEPVNFSDMLRRYSADLISKLAFGQDFGSLVHNSSDLADLMTWTEAMESRLTAPVKYWKLPGLGRWFDSGDAAVARLRSKVCALLDVPQGAAATVLAKLVAAEGGKLSREEIIANLITLFIAGTDTSSHTTSWALYHLSQQPDLQRQIAAEAGALRPGLATAEQVAALPMTQAVWKETLRVRSVVPFFGLECTEDITLAGKHVPKGTNFWVMTRELTRRAPEAQEALGSDLDAWRPARWLAPGGGVKSVAPFDSLTFGHGARACLGRRLADLSGPLVLAELLRGYEVLPWQGPALLERANFVVCPSEDVTLRLRRRL